MSGKRRPPRRKRAPRRTNPVARALRRLRPKVVPSAKGYRRRPKHPPKPDGDAT